MAQELAFCPQTKTTVAWPTLDLPLPLRKSISSGNFPRADTAQAVVQPQPKPLVQQPPMQPHSSSGGAGSRAGFANGPIREMTANEVGKTPNVTYTPPPQGLQIPIGEPGGVSPNRRPIRECGPRQ